MKDWSIESVGVIIILEDIMKSLYRAASVNAKRNLIRKSHSSMLLKRLYQTKTMDYPRKAYKEGLHIRSISGQMLKKIGSFDKQFGLLDPTQHKNANNFEPAKIIKPSQSRIQVTLKKERANFYIGLMNMQQISKKSIKSHKYSYLNTEYARKFTLLKDCREKYRDERNLTGVMKCAKLNGKCDARKERSCSSQKMTCRKYLTCQNFKPPTSINRVEFFIPAAKQT
eukprot:TRINITY_DN12628_c0_g1_i2.p1 TRINITY_DN12628_c0_g1~~TRINITY_DN12628_c0_g1_i2.p1  ORF type:complete len:226 (-),score=31.65 TRINITY_DN12628_c0_g1_i2:158-835(-)